MNANNNLRTIYYAHCRLTYDTPKESTELEWLRIKYPRAKVICPNNSIGKLNDFKDYLHVVDCCSQLIVSEIDGYVSKGVFSEIARALGNNTPVFVLRRQDAFYLLKVSGIEIVNEGSWKNIYGKVIVKK